MSQHLHIFLMDWLRHRENASAIDLAKIFDKCNIFMEAVRLDPLGESIKMIIVFV